MSTQKKGLFITFEGSEGCGKSTQSQLLCEYLKEQGHDVVFLREPGGTEISEKIRQILLDKKNGTMTAMTEMLLYMASRAQTVSEVIAPALKADTVVICDRFLDSTLAYQGFGLGMDRKAIEQIGALVTGGLQPDLTIFLDLPVEHGLKHRKDSEDRIEQRALAFHERVRKGYHTLASENPQRIKVVKVEDEKSATQENIRKFVRQLLDKQA